MPSSWQPNAVQAPQCVTFLTIDAAMRKVRGERPVLVGDPTWDCVAARRAEIPSLAVRTGGFSADEPYDAGADHVVDTLEDLARLLVREE
jgi:phosphoglycolate phosphatase-like HAD superfamily hydrolase